LQIVVPITIGRIFNGTNTRILVAKYPAIQWANQFAPFTYSVWVVPALLGAVQYYLDQTSSVSNALSIRIRQNANNKIEALIEQKNVGILASIESADAVSLDELIFIGIINDGTNFHLFIKGVEDANSPIPIGAGAATMATGNLNIGTRFDSTQRLDGSLAEVAAWDDSLTPDEIMALYHSITPSRMRPGSLKLYIPVRGLSFTEANLASITTKNNGTVTIAPKANSHAPVGPYASQLVIIPQLVPPPTIPVLKSVLFKQNIIQPITKPVIFQQNIITPVTKNTTLKQTIINAVPKIITLKHNIINAVPKLVVLQNNIIEPVQKAITLKNNIIQALQKTIIFQHNTIHVIQKTVIIKHNIINTVIKNSTLKQNIINPLQKLVTLKNSIRQSTTKQMILTA